jgi:hypothetical protein
LLRLHEVGRRLALVTLAEEAPDPLALPPGVLVHHLPGSELPFDVSFLDGVDASVGEGVPEFAPPIHFTGATGER